MISKEDSKEISQYIILAAASLGWDDENNIKKLACEVERQIRLHLPHNEKSMRKYVEDIYNSASIVYSTGRSYLFYKRHDRKPKELKFGFPKEFLYQINKSKAKYITEEEFDIIRERLKSDPSKRLCNSRCYRFWKFEEQADRYYFPVTFHGENPDYCDKLICDCEDSL